MEAGSYWQSCYVSLVGDGSPNSVHTALTSPHCTVENILDSEDVFQVRGVVQLISNNHVCLTRCGLFCFLGAEKL